MKMITHKDAADLTAALYAGSGSSASYAYVPSVEWLYMSPMGADCFFAVIRIDDLLFIVFRGSFDFKDWVHDILAWATVPSLHPKWGPVHPGFYIGTDESWTIIKKFLKATDRVVFIGHSLGAAHAIIGAANMASELGVARPPSTIVWGEPKTGFAQFNGILRYVPGISYQNGDDQHHDLVTEVPFSFPPMLYAHRFSLTRVSARPHSDIESDIGPFAWHHFSLYASVTPETII